MRNHATGRRAIIVGNHEAALIDLTDDTATRWSLPQPEEANRSWQAFLIADGRELLLFDWFSLRVHRYALP